MAPGATRICERHIQYNSPRKRKSRNNNNNNNKNSRFGIQSSTKYRYLCFAIFYVKLINNVGRRSKFSAQVGDLDRVGMYTKSGRTPTNWQSARMAPPSLKKCMFIRLSRLRARRPCSHRFDRDYLREYQLAFKYILLYSVCHKVCNMRKIFFFIRVTSNL